MTFNTCGADVTCNTCGADVRKAGFYVEHLVRQFYLPVAEGFAAGDQGASSAERARCLLCDALLPEQTVLLTETRRAA